MPSSSGGIPVEKSFETSSEEEEFIHEDDRTRIERESVNRAARAAFATNREDRNELIALRLKFQEMQRMLEKRGISLVDLEKEALNERVEFNAGLNDASKFISGRDEFGLPVFTNKQGLAPKVDAETSGVKDSKGQEKIEDISQGGLKSILKKPKIAANFSGDNGSIEKEDGQNAGNSWAKVVRGPPPVANIIKFEYIPFPKGVTVVCPPDDVLQQGLDKFKNCVVGTFTKSHPPFKLVHDHALKSWSKFGLLDVFQKDSNVFIFKFYSEIDLHNFIARGTLYIGKSPLLISAWGMSPCNSPITSMHLWIKLSKVPDCYWTSIGLSSIASVVGNPLGADELTSKLDVLPFAKVCVQYEIGAPLPSKIHVMAINPCTCNKEEVDVLVSYPIKPLVCTSCKSLGHTIAACPVSKRIWVEKKEATGY
ncbi:hypothetical protein POM88_049639 [Heracleum sosnowskyi]|uniref:DUF4283 domain-containing protein n=1 Tax=Heracleum sosnowskyi TaxID=360622 RepID=A0AAD8GYI9_9APIA|nr:hypothetical protein POM88_049639 [Heracleum sosnowskyi]